jgi:hypothetical protein
MCERLVRVDAGHKGLSFTPGFQAGDNVTNSSGTVQGNDILGTPVFAPEEQHVYSL